MIHEYDNLEKMKLLSMAIWMFTFLFVAFGFRFIKGAVAFILMKLYELFIQRNIIF